MPYQELQKKIKNIIQQKNGSTTQHFKEICQILQATIPYYDWVGFYFANHLDKTLHLKAFAGSPTEHTVIPFGKGICGQVAVSHQNFIVPDVKAQDNYIACSIDVKAEIVIPIFKNGINIGQIDIDSHTADPFTKQDEELLVWVNEQVATIL